MKHNKTFDGLHFKNDTERNVFSVVSMLDGLPRSTLARIGHELSYRNWPDDLPGKPEGWDSMTADEKHGWIRPIKDYIDIKIGRKAILRDYQMRLLGKTAEEFEDWWDSELLRRLEENDKKLRKCYDGRNNSDDYRDVILCIITAVLGFSLGVVLTMLVL